jgi:shikimate kinase
MAVALVGFRGVGKTTVGDVVAVLIRPAPGGR